MKRRIHRLAEIGQAAINVEATARILDGANTFDNQVSHSTATDDFNQMVLVFIEEGLPQEEKARLSRGFYA